MNPPGNFEDDDDGVDENYDPEAEVGFDSKGPALLPECPVVTGEENEEILHKFRAKIYRWNDNQWKERGAGDLKFLKNKASSKIRLLMRQDKTGKLVANHFIQPNKGLCVLKPQKTTDKAWLWTCYDFSDEDASVQKLCVRFTSVEEFQRFKVEFDAAYALNKELFEQKQAPQEEEKKE